MRARPITVEALGRSGSDTAGVSRVPATSFGEAVDCSERLRLRPQPSSAPSTLWRTAFPPLGDHELTMRAHVGDAALSFSAASVDLYTSHTSASDLVAVPCEPVERERPNADGETGCFSRARPARASSDHMACGSRAQAPVIKPASLRPRTTSPPCRAWSHEAGESHCRLVRTLRDHGTSRVMPSVRAPPYRAPPRSSPTRRISSHRVDRKSSPTGFARLGVAQCIRLAARDQGPHRPLFVQPDGQRAEAPRSHRTVRRGRGR